MLASLILALTTVLGDGAQTNIVIESDVKESLGYTRQVLMGDQNTNLVDRSGVVVTKAETVALDLAADEVKTIADATKAGTEEALDDLYSKTNSMARYSKNYQIYFPPETTRSNITGYVAKESSDLTTDYQWVWYNYLFTMKPIRQVAYCGSVQTQEVKSVWLKADGTEGWEPDGISIVDEFGQTWNGCHKCKLVRPTWAQGYRCYSRRNDRIGERGGFSLGDANMTVDGIVPVTGVFTNLVNRSIEYYDKGICTGVIYYE